MARSAPGGWLPAVVVCCGLLVTAAAALAQAPEGPPADVAAPPADAERSASGLAWKVLKEGYADRPPDANDVVQVHVTGWTPQGVKFHSSYDQGEPAIFNLQSVFPGWQEALQMMVRGEKRLFWIPARLGPRNPGEGPEGDAVFEVVMIDILRMPDVPEAPDPSTDGVGRTPSGVLTERVEAGTGTEYPGPDSAVLLNYTGWTIDNKIFDTTIERRRPTAFPLGKVMPAFAEAVQMMVVGETRRVWIPENLAARNWVGSPEGMLVFEVTLVNILPEGALSGAKPELGAKPDSGTPPGSG